MARLLATCAAVALAACATVERRGPSFVCPAHGGPPWHELTTPSFEVTTDVQPHRAHELARELERMRTAVLAGLFPSAPPEIPTRVRVVVFASETVYEEFAPEGLRAYFTRNGLGEDVIVLPAAASQEQRLVLAHELSHHVARHVFPRQPRWFGEGLAGSAEALAEPEAEFGRLPRHRRMGFLARRVTVRELLAWDGRALDARWLDSATVLVNYLLHHEAARLGELQRRLARAEPPPAIWAEVFPEWDPARAGGPEQLDTLLLEHVRARTLPGRQVVPEVHVEKEARLLTPPEVHAVRLSLPLFARGRDVEAVRAAHRAEVEEALAEDPAHVIALQVKAALDGLDPLPLAERAVAAHPDDVRAWLWLGAAQRGRVPEAQRLDAFRRAVEVAPASSMAANNLAWHLLLQGHVPEALPHAERALRLAPGDPMVLDTYAGVLEARGDCPAALDVANRAVELLPDRATDAQRAPWLERVERLARRCGRASGGAVPARPPAAPAASG